LIEIEIWDQNWGLRFRIEDWDWKSGLGSGLGMEIGIKDYDFISGLGIGIWGLTFWDMGVDIRDLDSGLGYGFGDRN